MRFESKFTHHSPIVEFAQPCGRCRLNAWAAEAQRHTWRTPDDIKRRYRTASFLAGDVVIFNIKGNRYRLVMKVSYAAGIVLVKRFGTHADHDKMRF